MSSNKPPPNKTAMSLRNHKSRGVLPPTRCSLISHKSSRKVVPAEIAVYPIVLHNYTKSSICGFKIWLSLSHSRKIVLNFRHFLCRDSSLAAVFLLASGYVLPEAGQGHKMPVRRYTFPAFRFFSTGNYSWFIQELQIVMQHIIINYIVCFLQ